MLNTKTHHSQMPDVGASAETARSRGKKHVPYEYAHEFSRLNCMDANFLVLIGVPAYLSLSICWLQKHRAKPVHIKPCPPSTQRAEGRRLPRPAPRHTSRDTPERPARLSQSA